jgi:hypothetical protein
LFQHHLRFTIEIQTPWPTTMMQQYGHQNVVVIDATFGTNENKVNSLIVTYIAKLKKPSKHNET